MKNKGQILTEILFTEPSEIISNEESIPEHDLYNKVMQMNLTRANFDIEYESGLSNDYLN